MQQMSAVQQATRQHQHIKPGTRAGFVFSSNPQWLPIFPSFPELPEFEKVRFSQLGRP